jgi:hypothetical protein
VAGEPFDRCYHQACDTLSNVNFVGLRQLSGGAVHAIAVFAARKEPLGAGPTTTARKRSARSTRARTTTKLGHQNQR